MSDFKEGDIAWYMSAIKVFRHCGITPDYLSIVSGTIIKIEPMLIRIKGFIDIYEEEFNLIDKLVFKSKQDCIDAFKKRLDEL